MTTSDPVAEWDLSVHQRTLLERHARSNVEDVWTGRPISLIVLAEPLEILDRSHCSRIELIPPVHQRVYRMGLEHLGFVAHEPPAIFVALSHKVLRGKVEGERGCPGPTFRSEAGEVRPDLVRGRMRSRRSVSLLHMCPVERERPEQSVEKES